MAIDPTLGALIREQIGPLRYGVFFAVGEGSFFPNGSEESSGCVVTEADEHYDYWTGWDATAGRETFDQWAPLDRSREWSADAEYLAARADAGLPSDVAARREE